MSGKNFLLLFLSCLPALVAADAFSPPVDYYRATAGLNGTELDGALNDRIRGHTVRTYDQIRQDLAVTDRDWAFPPPVISPSAITQILLIYSIGWSGYSRSGVWDGGSTWNREHTWPDSRGVGQPDLGPDFSDLHQLRSANPSANTSRSNNWYDAGGTLAPVTQAPLARLTADTWEPPDVDKGWVSRACLYMATRYDGTEPNTTDLVLVETPPTSTSANPPQMGRLSTLLLWNRQFPPGEWERRRNQIIYDQFQGNRNPFIDHPEFADVLYEAPLGRETRLTWRYRNFSLTELETDAVSGDLADPDGDGQNNLIEFALGGNPRLPAPVGPTLARVAPATLRFTYSRQRDRALSALTYEIESSPYLQGPWIVSTASEIIRAVEGTVETVSADLPANQTVFVRLRITRD